MSRAGRRFPSPRGRIDVSASIKEQSLARLRLPCRYDEYSEDIPANQVMKLTARYLCRSGQVSQSRRDALKRLLPFLSGVSDSLPRECPLGSGQMPSGQPSLPVPDRNLPSGYGASAVANPDGSREIYGYMDGQPMHLLYEKFILEYYRRHFPGPFPQSRDDPLECDCRRFHPSAADVHGPCVARGRENSDH